MGRIPSMATARGRDGWVLKEVSRQDPFPACRASCAPTARATLAAAGRSALAGEEPAGRATPGRIPWELTSWGTCGVASGAARPEVNVWLVDG